MSESQGRRDSDHVTDHPRHAGRVRRYHTWVVHHHQTVGEHCWQVARVYEAIFGQLSSDTERYIRHHDTAELGVGDPPFPVKASSLVLKAEYDRLEHEALARQGVAPLPKLSDTERARVKVCDLVEMMELGMTEREMGNLLAVAVVLRTERAARDIAWNALEPHDRERVLRYIAGQWARHEMVLRAGDVSCLYNYAEKEQAT